MSEDLTGNKRSHHKPNNSHRAEKARQTRSYAIWGYGQILASTGQILATMIKYVYGSFPSK